MPVSNIWAFGSRVSNGRRLAVDRPAVGRLDRVDVERLTDDVEHVAEDGVADGHGDRATGVAHLGAAGQAVGRLHGDRTHAALADLLGHLGDDGHHLGVTADGEIELEGGVDLGDRPGGELDVDHGAGDGDDPARRVIACRGVVGWAVGCEGLGCGHRGSWVFVGEGCVGWVRRVAGRRCTSGASGG
jgi:hypothetical protein